MTATTQDNEQIILKNLQAAFEHSPMCMMLAKCPAGEIVYANQAAERFLEQDLEDMADINNSNYLDYWNIRKFTGEPIPSHQCPLTRSMQSGEVVSNETFQISIDDNKQKWSLANASPIYNEDHQIIASMVLWSDITEQKNTEDDLIRKANFDQLTGIYSRQKIVELAERKLQRIAMDNETQCFILIDVDNFKDINDEYGHPAGDDVLAKFVGLISDNIRPNDLFGRYGGEEFLIISHHATTHGCIEFAEKLRALVENTPIDTEAGELGLTLSASVVSVGASVKLSFNHLIRRLDNALYNAKRGGRNRVYKIV